MICRAAAFAEGSTPSKPADGNIGESALAHFRSVRQASVDLVADLAPEDTVVQSMPGTSPSKWHLAHTT